MIRADIMNLIIDSGSNCVLTCRKRLFLAENGLRQQNLNNPAIPNYYGCISVRKHSVNPVSTFKGIQRLCDGSGLIVPPKTVSNVPPVAE